MNQTFFRFRECVGNSTSHFLILSGNIHDTVVAGGQVLSDMTRLLEELTSKKWKNFFRYDAFQGITKVRATEHAEVLVGLKPPPEQPAHQQTKKPKAASEFDPALQAMFDRAEEIGQQAVGKQDAEEKVLPPLVVFKRFDRLLKEAQERTVVLITFPERIFPQNNPLFDERIAPLFVGLAQWSQNERFLEKGHLVIILGTHAEDLARELPQPSRARVFHFPKPEEKEIVDYTNKNTRRLSEQECLQFARAAVGLCLKTIDRMLKEECAFAQLLDRCFEEKRRCIVEEYGDVLEIVKPGLGFEVIGGLTKVVDRFKSIAKDMRNGRVGTVPQGVLLMGPPGTGKTLFAEALAKDAGVNFVRLLDVKSMWVGESERRMSRVITALKELSPVIVFIDEVDQTQGKRGEGFDGDSGVSKNLFKKMLEVMSDPSQRGRIVWIMATNRPDLIDAAMKRTGRCDLRIPLLLPDLERRMAIFERAHLQFPDMKVGVKNWRSYAEACEACGGSDIVEIVRRAWEHALRDDRQTVTDGDVVWAMSDYVRPTSNERDIAQMSLLALQECSSRELLPKDECFQRARYQAIVDGLPPPTHLDQVPVSRASLLEIQ